MTAAIRDTSSREYFQLLGHDLVYARAFADDHNYHKSALSVFPEDDMTWGMWTTALIAVNWFIERYRGWDFMFAIILVDEMDQRKWVQGVGEGSLWTLDELPPLDSLV